MLRNLLNHIDDAATKNLEDPEVSILKGVTKAFGYGAIQGMIEGLVILGAATTVYSVAVLTKAVINK